MLWLLCESMVPQGLKEMGFDVSDAMAVRALQAEIDMTSTGRLTEAEFCQGFRKYNRRTLSAKLSEAGEDQSPMWSQKPDVEPMSVTLVDYHVPEDQAQHQVQLRKQTIEFGRGFTEDTKCPYAVIAASCALVRRLFMQ